jgi:hypothetical protein
MADRNVQVLTPATSFDLMTLDEAKLMMGIATSDTSDDEQLQLFIDVNSATVMRMCNRIFAREEIRESWRELNGGDRVFLSHWPVAAADLQSVESPAGTLLDPSGYELEETSGKVSIFTGAFVEPVVITYTGGYDLPDDAPLPLKRAVAMLNMQSRLLASLGNLAGTRMIAHKEARVAFHDPLKILEAAMGPQAVAGVMALLSHYIHYEV